MTNTTTIYHHDDFIVNKYHDWYSKIIIKAQSEDRVKGSGVYFERHHIVPKSMGGSNDSTNLVLLTAKEHYIVHLILPKMCIVGSKSYVSMVYAFHMMYCNKSGKRYSSRLYESMKASYFKVGGRKHTTETKILLSYLNKGKKASEETKRKISEAHKGRTMSLEQKQLLSEAKKGIKHPLVIGYYITPHGRFLTSREAVTELLSYSAIQRWCKNPNKVVHRASFQFSKYLQSLPESPVGKTFGDLGFGFELFNQPT